MCSFSSRVEPFGVATAARSPPDPRAVAAAAVASIACSRRTPESRPALVQQPSAQARRQSHPVQAAFAAIRASDPLGTLRGSSGPRRRRNRSTTRPRRTPEPSFFTPQARQLCDSKPRSRSPLRRGWPRIGSQHPHREQAPVSVARTAGLAEMSLPDEANALVAADRGGLPRSSSPGRRAQAQTAIACAR
jgi:hypothetical protein